MKQRKALEGQLLGLSELADKLNTTPSNLSGKLKRDNFSEKELQDIAEACGATFEGNFIITSTGKKI